MAARHRSMVRAFEGGRRREGGLHDVCDVCYGGVTTCVMSS